MKRFQSPTRKTSPEPVPARHRSQRGIALVVVLIFLVLLTVLVLAFFSSVTSEYTASKTYSYEVSAKFLSDSAVNIVMGQIAKATQGQSSSGSARLTWASQPGMIRTWDDTGNAEDCYKLYSAGSMVITGSVVQSGSGAVLNALQNDVPAGWSSQPAIYTDLNAPVTDSSGAVNFPIIDGNNIKSLNVSGSSVLTYQSGSATTPSVEGFYVQPSYVPNFNASGSLTPANTPVPMPVAWLYLLKDGTVISPDAGGSGTAATFQSGSIQPSASNPIVGRIAFWTDDETCKLNINTASEGSYYDSPHVNTPTDMWNAKTLATSGSFGFSISPPARGEYNRYPGHPASTCLSVALGHWLDNPSGTIASNAYTSSTNNANYLGLIGTGTSTAFPDPTSGTYMGLSAYLLLAPRVKMNGTAPGAEGAAAGSLAGTANETKTSGISTGGNTGTFPGVASGSDRLYTSIDELIFRYPMVGDAATRTQFPNPNLSGTLAKPALETLKFFLTASSRAPELTPFNTPKVSMWPQWFLQADRNDPNNYYDFHAVGAQSNVVQDPAKMAAYQLLAFCSSFGTNNALAASLNWPGKKNEYFFQWYATIKNNKITAGQPSYKYANQDWNYVPRNQQLATYLCNLGAKAIPGYGAAFTNGNLGKYSRLNFSNIVIESLDFIRSDVAYVDCVVANNTNGWSQPISCMVVSGSNSTLPGLGPTDLIKGYGNDQTCTQIVIGATLSSGTNVTPFIALDTLAPSVALESLGGSPNVIIKNPANLGLILKNGGTVGQQLSLSAQGGPGLSTGIDPLRGCLIYLGNLAPFTFASSGTSSGSTMTVGSGQPVTFDFYDSAGQNVVQEITLTFPQVQIPKPTLAPMADSNLCYLFTGTTIAASPQDLANPTPSGTADPTICSARGMEATAASLNGDWRLLAGLPVVSGTMSVFTPSANYNSTTVTQAHSLRIQCLNNTQPILLNNNPVKVPTTSLAGSLVSQLKNTDYADGNAPCVPLGLTAALMANGMPGDWDTGPGNMPDGPYLSPAEKFETVGSDAYFGHDGPRDVGGLFSPNRMVASAIRFGSLPTGVRESPPQPWQTLLFCPNPAGRQTPVGGTPTAQNDHHGFMNPPDHLYLEFFTMPVVQPYAISEPLSTAGKVNLNYQLAPFTNIERSTALRGVLKNTLVTGISDIDVKVNAPHPTDGTNSQNNLYKWQSDMPSAGATAHTTRYPYELRYDINRDATIAGIEKYYFNAGQLFRYPSEICDVFLVPQKLQGATYNPQDQAPPTNYDDMMSWWSKMPLTGDNLREEPYNHIYPRLTTQSNTYTVHYRVQVLKKLAASNQAEWDEGRDVVTAEYRGSSLIERYIDPNDPALNSNWDADTISLNLSGTNHADLSTLYKFRVISTKQFAP